MAGSIFLALTGCGPVDKPLTPAHKAVEAQFKSKSEPAARDAIWTSPSIFKVGVLNNGSNRDGYALYVCEVIREHGLAGNSVQAHIIDIVALVNKGEWNILGKADCDCK